MMDKKKRVVINKICPSALGFLLVTRCIAALAALYCITTLVCQPPTCPSLSSPCKAHFTDISFAKYTLDFRKLYLYFYMEFKPYALIAIWQR